MSFALKKQIKKELLCSDWAGKVEETAVAVLATVLEEQHGGQLHALHDILRNCTLELSADGKITAASVLAAATPNGGAQQVELVEFVDAFSVPRLAYDPVQHKLYLNTKPRQLHASAEAKHQLYLQRLMMIQQRLMRSRMFQQSNLLLSSASNRANSIQLTDLQSLKGVFGVTRYVLGCISRSEDGRYVLEDTTGAVPLNLSAAETAAGFYTENCVVIAEGALNHDGAFHVRALGLPPVEPRSALPLAAQRLNYWGGAGGGLGPDSEAGAILALEEAQRGASDRVVVLANVWLDRAEVLDSLHTLLGGFSGVPVVPAVFVLMGNFHSRAGTGGGFAAAGGRGGCDAMLSGCDVDYGTMRELFGQLATLIDQYPRLKAESRFVFLPGPDDPGPGAILPQPPLPRSLTAELRRVLPNAVFASNPCRMRYATQQVVFFRHDLQRRLRRRTLLPLAGAPDGAAPDPASQAAGTPSGPSSSALWGHLALTLLQQAHLAPLPLLAQPVYWQHDSAMSLYPLPDAVLLADASASQEEFVHEGCRVVNPGCFPAGFFAAYLPCVQQVEMSELPRPGEELGVGGDGDGEAAQELGAAGVEAGGGSPGDDGRGSPNGQGVHGQARAPLQVRQAQPAQPAQQQQKKKAAAANKPRQPRAPRQAGQSGQAGRGGKPRAAAVATGDEAPDAGGEGAAGDAGADVEMLDPEAEQSPGGAGAGGVARNGKAAAGGDKGEAKGRGAGAKGTKGGARQGTLAQAWAKQPVGGRRSGGGAEEGLLEDEDEVEVVVREDGDEEMEEGDQAEAARMRRQQQQARKRRAMVVDEGEEEEGKGGVEDAQAGGTAGNEGAGAGAAARTWMDEEEEDWEEDE